MAHDNATAWAMRISRTGQYVLYERAEAYFHRFWLRQISTFSSRHHLLRFPASASADASKHHRRLGLAFTCPATKHNRILVIVLHSLLLYRRRDSRDEPLFIFSFDDDYIL